MKLHKKHRIKEFDSDIRDVGANGKKDENMKKYSRVCAEINLDHFEHNLNEIKRLISATAKVAAVIKADGYGHGAVALAQLLEKRHEIWGYAVATAEEASILRKAGMTKPILILGYVFPEDYPVLIGQEIRPAVFSLEMAQYISEAAVKLGKTAYIHIKLDTGMSRIGFQCTEESSKIIVQISKLPNIMIEGIFTHFAKADETDKTFTQSQAELYEKMTERLKKENVRIPIHHISNSAGIVDLPQYNLDMVRAGIILYGLWPSDEIQKENIDLKPLMTLKSHVVHVKELESGRTISYGGTYKVEGTKKIATIPVGYGDGYPRTLSNKGYVLIHGKQAPVCGRVCMDQFMVDVTDIPEVNVGDEVILIGSDKDETITMEDMGELADRFNYEFACDLGKRIPRVYLRHGERVSEHTLYE